MRYPAALAAVALFAAVAAPALGTRHGRFTRAGTVTYVVDGDTVDVRLRGGGLERVRLIGIDTPERGRCDAARATSLAVRLALGRRVTLRGDATQATRDRYGRLLAYVWIHGDTDLGYRQLVRGYARVYVYDRPFARLAAYRRAEALGRRRPDGIWRACRAPATGSAAHRCAPSYPDARIPPPPPDLGCRGVPFRGFRVVGADPHRFDGDGNGVGCEG